MPHTASWLVDKRIVLLDYTGDVDKNELNVLNEELQQFVEDGIAPVHIISNNSNMGTMPMDVKTLRKSFGVMNHHKWGMICIVGADTMLKFFAQVVSSSLRLKKMALTTTVEEAHQKIMAYDDTLEAIG